MSTENDRRSTLYMLLGLTMRVNEKEPNELRVDATGCHRNSWCEDGGRIVLLVLSLLEEVAQTQSTGGGGYSLGGRRGGKPPTMGRSRKGVLTG